MKKCPKCKSKKIMGVEYRMTDEDYDGISEYRCECGYRQGRWSKKELKNGELEKCPFVIRF
jgi:DNA-directed RNA polymerase subunit M/transcription elongation factor TFIIS